MAAFGIDRRDPQRMGETMLTLAALVRSEAGKENMKMSRIVDMVSGGATLVFDDILFNLDLVDMYDSRIGPVEKYGDPRRLHERRVADGMEPTI